MWIRSAFWTGTIKPGSEDDFRNRIYQDIAPGLRLLPGVRGARVLWPERLEDTPPAIACQVLVEFDDAEGIAQMIASPKRKALRERVFAAAALFDGKLSHIDYRVGD